MIKCYACKESLENGRSFEHIINNSIGGHEGFYDLLCKKCNERFGDTIDKELSGQLRDLGILLDIKRDRALDEPKIKMSTADGQIKEVGFGMKPHIKLSFPTKDKHVEIFTTDNKYKGLVRAKTRELSKDGTVTFVESTELPTKEKYYLKNDFSQGDGFRKFGGPLMHRSVAKICVNRYLARGYEPKYCAGIIQFIKGNLKPYPHFYYFPTTYTIHKLQKGEVSHVIYLRGDTRNRVLYAYIELFNFENSLVIFDMEYSGEDFTDSYIWDTLIGKEVEKNISIRLTRNHLEDLDLICQDFYNPYVQRFNNLLQIIEQRQKEGIIGASNK